MTRPVFRRGLQAPPDQDPVTWLAKYDGECALCDAVIEATVTRVRWDDDGFSVVCAFHRDPSC